MPAADDFSDRPPDPSRRFDVVVVGGGAAGCAVAWEAASRGLDTALLERDDFGAATSANSLGIIHGGLRYLQRLDLRRARASSRERAIMLRIAPHLVAPLECAVPTLPAWQRGRAAFAAGLAVNRALQAGQPRGLAATHRIPGGGLISGAELARRAPGLEMAGVTGGARWFDARMSSGERLALAFALSAKAHGAVILNHAQASGPVTDGARIAGVAATDSLTGRAFELAARVVVDCRGVGPSLQPGLYGDPGIEARFVRAVNVILPDQGLVSAVGAPLRDARRAPVPGRLLFALPAGGATIAGTWYFSAGSGREGITPRELDGILQAVNGAFPGWRLAPDDVLGVHVGFLPAGEAAAPEPIPIDRPALVSSAAIGGLHGLWHAQTEKWTMVRALAERLINTLARDEGLPAAPSRTSEQALVGGGPVTLTAEQSAALSRLTPEQAARIRRHYGSRAGHVLDYISKDPDLAGPVPGAAGIVRAELPYVLDHEQVRTLADLLRRLAPGEVRGLPPETATFLAERMGARRRWPEARRQVELKNLYIARSGSGAYSSGLNAGPD